MTVAELDPKAGQEGVEAVFEPSLPAYATQMSTNCFHRGDLLGWQRRAVLGHRLGQLVVGPVVRCRGVERSDAAHLVKADSVGVEGEESIGGIEWGESRSEQEPERTLHHQQAVGAEADPDAVDPGKATVSG